MPRRRNPNEPVVARFLRFPASVWAKLQELAKASGHAYEIEVLEILIENATLADVATKELREALLAGDQQQEVSAGDETERPGESASREPVEAVEAADGA